MGFQRIFFDLDGTLTDSSEGIFNGIRYAVQQLELTALTEAELRSFVGPPLLTSFQQRFQLTTAAAEQAVITYREYYSRRGINEFKIYAGVPETLALLAENYELYVATSKPEVFAKKMLETAALTKYFKEIYGADLGNDRSEKAAVIRYGLQQLPSLAGERMLMVGDRSHDIIGAKKNGLASAGVLFGFGSREELTAAGADWLVEKPQELVAVAAG